MHSKESSRDVVWVGPSANCRFIFRIAGKHGVRSAGPPNILRVDRYPLRYGCLLSVASMELNSFTRVFFDRSIDPDTSIGVIDNLLVLRSKCSFNFARF